MFPIKVETRILLNCPHCKFSSRYDAGFITDAIHDYKEISCVACGGHIRIIVVGLTRAAEHRNEAEGEQGGAVPTEDDVVTVGRVQDERHTWL